MEYERLEISAFLNFIQHSFAQAAGSCAGGGPRMSKTVEEGNRETLDERVARRRAEHACLRKFDELMYCLSARGLTR